MRFLLLVALLLLAPAARADDPAVPSTADALSPFLKELIRRSMPTPLGEVEKNWGQQKEVTVGVKWRGLRPEKMHSVQNDGHWTKTRVDAVDPASSFGFGLEDLKSPAPNTTSFTANVALRVRVVHDNQVWKSGHRLYGGQTRATAYVTLKLKGEMSTRFETPAGSLLPTAIVTVRVSEADLDYTDLKCEHIAGMDGKAAKALGTVLLATLRAAKPRFEADMKAKANAAIVKTADSKEIRVELAKLFPGGVLVKE
jgi:hypothetical protein